MSKALTIAIDGYSSTGKSTLAKQLAHTLGYRYVDTGAMYRAVTLYAMENHLFNPNLNAEKLIEKLPEIKLSFRYNVEKGLSDIVLNGQLVEDKIRDLSVSNNVSEVAALAEVRRKLVAEQQAMGRDGGVVMDGRDIGTVVFPDAELKIFMTASEDTRIKRRWVEMKEKNNEISREEVAANIVQRDLMDTSREDSPLRQAEGSVLLDNTDLSPDDQLELALRWVRETKTITS